MHLQKIYEELLAIYNACDKNSLLTRTTRADDPMIQSMNQIKFEHSYGKSPAFFVRNFCFKL